VALIIGMLILNAAIPANNTILGKEIINKACDDRGSRAIFVRAVKEQIARTMQRTFCIINLSVRFFLSIIDML
jgi:hypothetical protein